MSLTLSSGASLLNVRLSKLPLPSTVHCDVFVGISMVRDEKMRKGMARRCENESMT